MFKMLGALFLGGFFLLIYLVSSGNKMIPAGMDISTLSLVLIFGGLGLVAVGNLLDHGLPKRNRAPRYNNNNPFGHTNQGSAIPSSLRSRPMPTQRSIQSQRQTPTYTQSPMGLGEWDEQDTQYRR